MAEEVYIRSAPSCDCSGNRKWKCRRKARRRALQVLYAMDCNPKEHVEALYEGLHVLSDRPSTSVACLEVVSYLCVLVEGTREHIEEVDRLIRKGSRSWRLDRMSRVDRNIIRMALFEILHLDDVPTRVALNEAVEVAKAFGSSASASFVNGVLDGIARGLSA